MDKHGRSRLTQVAQVGDCDRPCRFLVVRAHQKTRQERALLPCHRCTYGCPEAVAYSMWQYTPCCRQRCGAYAGRVPVRQCRTRGRSKRRDDVHIHMVGQGTARSIHGSTVSSCHHPRGNGGRKTTNRNRQVRCHTSRQLDAATLATTVSLTDYSSCFDPSCVGQPYGDVSVNLTWTATGPATRVHDVSTVHAPGFTTTSHFSGTFRPATASGTISDGTTNFALLPLQFAQIASVSNGTVTISR
jgi:hypothetical protein